MMTAPYAIPCAMEQRSETPLKRNRTQALQVAQRISGDLAKTSVECDDTVEMDHVRGCKRFLSESMAADMSRMSCGKGFLFGTSPENGASGDDSPSGSPMATERLSMATSPMANQAVNPFGSPNGRCGRPCGSDASSPTNTLGGFPMSSSPSGGSSEEVTMMTPQPPTPPMAPHRSTATAMDRVTGFATPTPTRMRLLHGEGCSSNGTMDASEAERLPPSPSDPALAQDLRRTALLRSCLQRTEDRPAASMHARFQPHHSHVAPIDEKPLENDQQRRQLKLAADLDAASHIAAASHGASHPRPQLNAELPQLHQQSSLMGRARLGMPFSGGLPAYRVAAAAHTLHHPRPPAAPLAPSQLQPQSQQHGYEEAGGLAAAAPTSSPPPLSCGSMSMSMDVSAADGDCCDFSDQEADGPESRSRRIDRSTSVTSLHIKPQQENGHPGGLGGIYAPGAVFAFSEDDFPPTSLPGF